MRFDRSKAPEAGTRTLLEPVRPYRSRLDNGMGLVWVQRDRLPGVSLSLVLPAGADSAGVASAGIASLVGKLLPQGAAGRSAREMAFWIDGKLWRRDGQVVSHIGQGFPKGQWMGGWWRPDIESESSFEGFQWRTSEELAVNYVWAYLYMTRAPEGHVSKVWFDNIVIAKEYIGPISTSEAE